MLNRLLKAQITALHGQMRGPAMRLIGAVCNPEIRSGLRVDPMEGSTRLLRVELLLRLSRLCGLPPATMSPWRRRVGLLRLIRRQYWLPALTPSTAITL